MRLSPGTLRDSFEIIAYTEYTTPTAFSGVLAGTKLSSLARERTLALDRH